MPATFPRAETDPDYAAGGATDVELADAVAELQTTLDTKQDAATAATTDDLADHTADTTAVHGIADTAQLPVLDALNTFTQKQTISAAGVALALTSSTAELQFGSPGDGISLYRNQPTILGLNGNLLGSGWLGAKSNGAILGFDGDVGGLAKAISFLDGSDSFYIAALKRISDTEVGTGAGIAQSAYGFKARSQKITGVADGTAADDAATKGQIPTQLPPTAGSVTDASRSAAFRRATSYKTNGQAGMYAPTGPGSWANGNGMIANILYYGRFVADRDMTVTTVSFYVSGSAGAVGDQVAVGLMDASGARLTHSGVFTPGLNVTGAKNVDVPDVSLTAGTVYYVCFSTSTFGGTAPLIVSSFFSYSELPGTAIGTSECRYTGATVGVPTQVGTTFATSACPLLFLKE